MFIGWLPRGDDWNQRKLRIDALLGRSEEIMAKQVLLKPASTHAPLRPPLLLDAWSLWKEEEGDMFARPCARHPGHFYLVLRSLLMCLPERRSFSRG